MTTTTTTTTITASRSSTTTTMTDAAGGPPPAPARARRKPSVAVASRVVLAGMSLTAALAMVTVLALSDQRDATAVATIDAASPAVDDRGARRGGPDHPASAAPAADDHRDRHPLRDG